MQDVLDLDVGDAGLEWVTVLAEALGVDEDDVQEVHDASHDPDPVPNGVADATKKEHEWIEAVRTSVHAPRAGKQALKLVLYTTDTITNTTSLAIQFVL